jgi:hypothetical protein
MTSRAKIKNISAHLEGIGLKFIPDADFYSREPIFFSTRSVPRSASIKLTFQSENSF